MKTIPEFIIGKSGGQEYVIHCLSPRFIAQIVHGDGYADIDPLWMETPKKVDRETVGKIAKLMRRAGEFYKANAVDFEFQSLKHKCKKCGHEWIVRRPEKPKRCASCKTPYWL